MSVLDRPAASVSRPDQPGDAQGRALVRASRTVLLATLASRLSGFARVAMVAAVLGPTFFANLFQTTLLVPYVLCQLMMGALIPPLLAPHLVRCLARGDDAGVARLAGGFLGVMLAAFACVAVVCAFAMPDVIRLLVAGVGDEAVRRDQIRLGVPLALCVLPQVLLAVLSGVGVAVQQAHGRFGLSTAAPALENLATILVMAAVALVFGVGIDVQHASMALVLLLGLGSTAGAGLHATAQCWGASRVGVVLRPRLGHWRDPEVRSILRGGLPAAGQSGLDTLAYLLAVVASGSVAGGTLAFQIAYNLFNLPVALGARPLASALVPLLAGCVARGDSGAYRAVRAHSVRLAVFMTLPIAALFVAMPPLLASAIAFGEMRTPLGVALIAACLAGLGAGLVGEAAFIVLSSAAYARHETVAPFVATVVRFAVVVVGVAGALTVVSVTARMMTLSAALSAGSLVAVLCLVLRQRPADTAGPGGRGLLRLAGDLGIAAVALAPAALVLRHHQPLAGPIGASIACAAFGVALTLAVYVALQLARGSPEARAMLGLLRGSSAGRDPGTVMAQDRLR